MYRGAFAFAVVSFVLLGGFAARADSASSYYEQFDEKAKKAIQLNLMWTGYYPGPLDGEIGDNSLQGIRRFQTESGEAPTGVMSARAQDALSLLAEQKQKQIDFRVITDKGTGARIGVPFAYISEQRETLRGAGYYSSDQSIEIQTIAQFSAIRDLRWFYDQLQLKDKFPSRQVWYAPYNDTWFVVAGRDFSNNREKHFYARFYTDGVQVRGFVVSYNPERQNIVPIVAAMSFNFDPFPPVSSPAPAPSEGQGGPYIPLQSKAATTLSVSMQQTTGGIYKVPVLINGIIILDFLVDSGASDVSIPLDVFSTLLRAGTITDSDIIGEHEYILADGSKGKSLAFRIRSLRVGDKVIENVTGSTVPAKAELLLGQSFLGRFRTWSVNNSRHELLLEQ